PPPLQTALHDEADQSLRQFHEIVKLSVSNLGFDHPELGQMPSRLRLFRAKRRTERVHLAQRHRRGLDVELARLCQIGLVIKIVDWKKCSGALTSRRSNNRGIGQGESAVVEEIARRLDDLRPHPQNRRLPLRPQTQMPALDQKVAAMLFRRARISI